MNRESTVFPIVGVTPALTSRGSIPRRLAPVHGYAPMHTGRNSRAACDHCGVR
jgi:hypothetical protein